MPGGVVTLLRLNITEEFHVDGIFQHPKFTKELMRIQIAPWFLSQETGFRDCQDPEVVRMRSWFFFNIEPTPKHHNYPNTDFANKECNIWSTKHY